MSKIFNVYLSSLQKVSGTNNNSNYFIDWSVYLQRGKYKCSFIFKQFGSNINLVAGNLENLSALLYINLGCNYNFLYSNTTSTLNNNNIIGILNYNSIGSTAVGKFYLSSDKNSNQPFFIDTNTILNNYINVKLLQLDGTTLLLDSNNNQITDYIICLSFELID